MRGHERYLLKAEILLEEAEKDFSMNLMNKAVSAYYFAIEALANAIASLLGQKTRGYMGRINLIKNLLGVKIANEMSILHQWRNIADHKEDLVSQELAGKVREKAKNLYEILKAKYLELKSKK